jgi:hypothetical protein
VETGFAGAKACAPKLILKQRKMRCDLSIQVFFKVRVTEEISEPDVSASQLPHHA